MGDVKLLHQAICDCRIDMQVVLSMGVKQFPLALCVCRIDMQDVLSMGVMKQFPLDLCVCRIDIGGVMIGHEHCQDSLVNSSRYLYTHRRNL